MDLQLIIKTLADGLVFPVVILGVFALLRYVPKNQRYQAYARVLMAGLTAYVVAKLIGMIYQPADLRPFELLGVEAGASFLNNPGFPSDHTLFMMAITLAIWFAAKKRKLAITALIMTILVGIGRVIALVHTPLDVVGGIVIACAGIIWYVLPDQKATKK